MLSDFEDEDAAGYYFDRDSDDKVEQRVAARESMDEDSNDEDVDAEGPRARARRRPEARARGEQGEHRGGDSPPDHSSWRALVRQCDE